MTCYGWLTEGSAFAKKPLLGKMSRDYVLEALKGVEIIEKPEQLSGRKTDLVIVIREDMATFRQKELALLLEDAKREAQIFRALGTDEPLAIAMNAETAVQVMKGIETLPDLTELEKRLKKAGLHTADWPADEKMESVPFPVASASKFSAAYKEINQRNIARHEENGVIFLDRDRTIVESDVVIAPGVMIYPGNTLQGSTRIGDFVEIKNSSIGDGTKVSHLTYVGDSDLGKDINLGCGVVFVNYDGKVKNRSKVEDHAFIGCNCNLVAPVHVGKNAYLAAGSTVVEDVPEDALFVARSRGVVKEDWVKRRKEAGKL